MKSATIRRKFCAALEQNMMQTEHQSIAIVLDYPHNGADIVKKKTAYQKRTTMFNVVVERVDIKL
jgi:fructose-1,6-bisphosphatase